MRSIKFDFPLLLDNLRIWILHLTRWQTRSFFFISSSLVQSHQQHNAVHPWHLAPHLGTPPSCTSAHTPQESQLSWLLRALDLEDTPLYFLSIYHNLLVLNSVPSWWRLFLWISCYTQQLAFIPATVPTELNVITAMYTAIEILLNLYF